MSSKTKIVVLRMKELIYTGIFAALGILLIILLIIMFLPQKEDGRKNDTDDSNTRQEISQTAGQSITQENADTAQIPSGNLYIPGIYTTQLVLNDQTIEIEVIVDQSAITSLKMINLNDTITTMYPLLQPAFESISEQIYNQQSVENITYDTDSKYTSLVLLEAIKSSLNKAQIPQ